MDSMYEKVREVWKKCSEERERILEQMLTDTKSANIFDGKICDRVDAECSVIRLSQELIRVNTVESILLDLDLDTDTEKIIKYIKSGVYFR